MAGEEVLDLRDLTTLCGDYTVHLLSALERLEKGRRLRVLVAPSEAEELRQAARSLVDAGVARIVEEGESGDAFYIVLEKTG